MTPEVMRKTGLAMLAAVAILGAAQVAALPSRADAQTAPDGGTARSRTVSATGIGQIPGDTAEQAGGALMMSIEERSNGSDVQGAVKTVQDRLAKLRAALNAAGIPDASIHVQGFNVGPQYGYPYPMPMPMPVEPDGGTGSGAVPPSGATAPARPISPPEPTGYVVNAQLMADTTGPEQLAAAMRVAIENGATNVNSFIKGGPGNPTPPNPDALGPAIRQATEQAKVMAQASAEASGVALGDIDSIAVLAPTPSYGGGPGPIPTVTWQVQVRVTYNLQ